MNENGEGAFLDIVFGIVSAVVGGLTFGLFGAGRVSGFNLYNLIAAVIGVAATCLSYNADPSTTRAPKPEREQEKNRGPFAGGTGPQHFTICLRYAGSWRQLRDRESPEHGLLSNKL